MTVVIPPVIGSLLIQEVAHHAAQEAAKRLKTLTATPLTKIIPDDDSPKLGSGVKYELGKGFQNTLGRVFNSLDL